jgi:hypothetical protein
LSMIYHGNSKSSSAITKSRPRATHSSKGAVLSSRYPKHKTQNTKPHTQAADP